jgi:ParB-like chromosome segregation protein Spo0J
MTIDVIPKNKDSDRQDSSKTPHEQHAKVKISDIKVGDRFRKAPGNIDDLVESIRKNSLLCPVTVTKDYLLIDGLRRIEACKKLDILVIPVHIVDLPIKENGEIDANQVRKDFSIEEKVAIKRYRESIEPNLQGRRNDIELPGKFPRSDNKQRRDERIAESTGVSYKTLQKMEEIVDAAHKNPQKFGPLLRKIDSGQTSVSKASKMIENENKKREILKKTRAEHKHNKNNDNLKLLHGDFRDVCRKEISDDSIDLIFTDPPYTKKDLHLYEQLGIEATRMLKEGGSLIMYAPHYALPEIFDYLKKWPMIYEAGFFISIKCRAAFFDGLKYYNTTVENIIIDIIIHVNPAIINVTPNFTPVTLCCVIRLAIISLEGKM